MIYIRRKWNIFSLFDGQTLHLYRVPNGLLYMHVAQMGYVHGASHGSGWDRTNLGLNSMSGRPRLHNIYIYIYIGYLTILFECNIQYNFFFVNILGLLLTNVRVALLKYSHCTWIVAHYYTFIIICYYFKSKV